MTLTADDLRRPAIKRIAHMITVLSTPIWIVPTLIAMLCGAVAFVFTLIAMGTDWLMRQVIRPLEELKWRAAEAYVKRWPTVQPSGLVLPQISECPEATAYTGVASGPAAKFRRYDTEPQPITPRPGDIDTRDSWGEGYSESVAKARAAGTYRDTVPAPVVAPDPEFMAALERGDDMILPPMISTLEMTPAKEAELLDALGKQRVWLTVTDDKADLYNELIMAISKKYPNETCHQTALRYIRQAEESSNSPRASDCTAAAKAN